jgi:putative membrane protein
MQVEEKFNSAELDAIRDAVAQAERRTSGEIVTYLVGRCDSYPEAALRAGVVGGAVGAAGSLLLFVFDPLRIGFLGDLGFGMVLSLPLLLGAVAASFCALSAPLQRLLLDREDIARRVQQRAEAAFLEQEVFATRERTGVLLFVALFEHRAVVLADSGITRLLPSSAWDGVVQDLCAGLRAGDAAASLCGAIDALAELLEGAGVQRRPDDAEELSNEPRLRDR